MQWHLDLKTFNHISKKTRVVSISNVKNILNRRQKEGRVNNKNTLQACVLSRVSRVCLFVTTWTVAHQAPLSTGFFRQEYWSGLPCPPPGDLSTQGPTCISYIFYIGMQILYH